MKIKLKDFLKKASETEPKVVAMITIFILFSIYFTIRSGMTYTNAITFIGVFVLIGAFYKYGVSVLKTIAVIFLIVYITSIYTTIASSLQSYVIEPFFFTIGAGTIFLATTYSEKNPQWNLSSRRISVTLLMVTIVSIKSAILLEGYSFLMAEIIGLNYLVLYIILWRTIVSNNRKTKITSPIEIYRKEENKIRVIKVEESLDENRKKYNSYLYKEVFNANEEGYNIIFISNSGSNRVFALDYMEIGNKKIPFILQEDKNEDYLKSTKEKFAEELAFIK